MSGDPSTVPAPPHGGAVQDVPSGRRALSALLGGGMIDAQIVATIWLLLEGRVALIVAAPTPTGSAGELMEALLDLLPAGMQRVTLGGGGETFDWLPQAGELGWDRGGGSLAADQSRAPEASALTPVRPDTTILVAPFFSDARPSDTWGEPARIAIRAASVGYLVAGTIVADSLEAVLATFRRPPIRLTDDELTRLGVVLVLDEAGAHVAAAHYLRPLARDEHGHVQRLAPAVLATYDAATGRFEHFGWGIWPELASRVGRRAGDFEHELERRRAFLDDLVASGVVDPSDVRAAIGAFPTSYADATASVDPPTSASPSAPTH